MSAKCGPHRTPPLLVFDFRQHPLKFVFTGDQLIGIIDAMRTEYGPARYSEPLLVGVKPAFDGQLWGVRYLLLVVRHCSPVGEFLNIRVRLRSASSSRRVIADDVCVFRLCLRGLRIFSCEDCGSSNYLLLPSEVGPQRRSHGTPRHLILNLHQNQMEFVFTGDQLIGIIDAMSTEYGYVHRADPERSQANVRWQTTTSYCHLRRPSTADNGPNQPRTLECLQIL